MYRRSLLVLLLWTSFTVAVYGDVQSKRVKPMEITGANGFTAKWKGERQVFYLGLRFPEEGLLFGSEAARLNRSLIEGKKPRIEAPSDADGPVVHAMVYVEDDLGREICLNEEFLRKGLAVLQGLDADSPRFQALAKAQQEASAPEPQGMWKDHPLLAEAKALAESGDWRKAGEALSSLMKGLEGKDGLLTDLPPLAHQWAEGKLLQAHVSHRLGDKAQWRSQTQAVMEQSRAHPHLMLPLAAQLARWGLKSQAVSSLEAYGDWEEAPVSGVGQAAQLAYALQEWPLSHSLFARLAGMRKLTAEEAGQMSDAEDAKKKADNVVDLASDALAERDFMKAWRSIRSLEQTGGVPAEELAALEEDFRAKLQSEISSLIAEGRVSDAKVLTSLPMAGTNASGALGDLSREVDRHLAEWQQALDLNTEQGFEAYLKRDPPEELRAMAEARLVMARESREAYKKALQEDTEQAYRTFLEEWPESREAELARAQLKKKMPQDSQDPVLSPQHPQQIANQCIRGVLFLKFTRGEEEGLGTAFVVSNKGYALTAAHCVRDPETGDYYDTIQTVRPAAPEKMRSITYRPTFDYARVIKVHRDYDVAVIKVPYRDLMVPLALGDSDTVRILDPVLVIGHPYGLDYTVTTGRINNILRKEMRDHRGRKSMFTLLQTDAAVNPGNSGGPLINALGEVIGICSASYGDARSEGLHFFVPINSAVDILP